MIQRPTQCPTCKRIVGQTPSFWNRARTPGIDGRPGWKVARHFDDNNKWCPGAGIEIEGEAQA